MMRHQNYPQRPSHFAYKFVRLLAKTCAAQSIGADGAWLLTTIAHTEDAKRYTGPVTFFNSQLTPLCGFKNDQKLIRVRTACVKAGWLHYEAGGRTFPGKYWVTIPDGFDEIPDTPLCETEHSHILNMETKRKQNGIETELNRKQNGIETETFYPSPNPSPTPLNTDESASADSCAEPSISADSAPMDEDLSDYQFPVKGSEELWTLPRSKLEEYRETYGDSVDEEIKRARQWARDNPPKRKAAKSMPRFLSNWLNNPKKLKEDSHDRFGDGSAAVAAAKRTLALGGWDIRDYGSPGDTAGDMPRQIE